MEGFSIPEQQDRIRKYCEAKGWELIKIYTDGGYSGAKLDRPALQDLIRECEQYDMVLVYKLDRLSRSQKDTLYLIEDVFKKNGVDFTSMQENFDTSTPFGMAMIGILSVFAQLEREQIKERMTMGKLGRVKDGYWTGAGIPFGYDYIPNTNDERGHLVINEEQAEMVRKIFELYISGISMRQVAKYMYDHYGRKFDNSTSVMVVIDNPVYYGMMKWKGKTYPGNHEPIISEETWKTAHQIRMRSKRTNNGKANHLLTGVIYCGKCGSKMFWKSTRVRGREYSYYTCKIYSQTSVYFTDSVKKCDNRQVRADEVEAKVIEVLSKLKLEDIKKEPRPVDNTKQIEAIEKRIERAAELYVMDGVSIEATRRLVADLSAKKAKLEAEMAEQPAYKAQEDALKDLPRVLSSDDESLRNRAVKALVKRVTVTGLDIDIQLNF